MLESTVTDYLAGSDPRDPRCSAIFADMHGFPPMLIQVGENEILYDDATRIRDAATTAGVDVAFESWRPWNPRVAGIYLCRAARIRRRDRTLGNFLQNPSGTLSIGNVAVIELLASATVRDKNSRRRSPRGGAHFLVPKHCQASVETETSSVKRQPTSYTSTGASCQD